MQKSRKRLVEQPAVKLSCEQCQLRKTKCDRTHPCGACQRANIDCNVVQRRRLPRGRTAPGRGKDADLRDQVARLESLLSNLISDTDAGKTLHDVSAKTGEQQVPSASVDKFTAHNIVDPHDFVWTALNDKMVGIREVLDRDFPEDDAESACQEPAQPAQSFDIVLFGVSSCAINPSIIEPPPESSIYALLNIYLSRVDPLYKMMHVPSLRTLLLAEPQGLRNPRIAAASDALRFAVYFTAACTLDETECQNIFQKDKNGMRDEFRLATEVMLSTANLQTTRDITVLQAFAVYLVGRRTCPGQKDIAMLVACAIRVAQIIGLDVDESLRNSFQQEMRRRLWYSICLLDMQAALDGGLRAITAQHGSRVRRPMRINDADISPALERPPVELRGFTDMSFSAMTHEALLCWRRLSQGSADSEGQPNAGRHDWAVRSQQVKDLEKKLRETYLQYCDMSQPFQLFTSLVGEGMIVTMQLLERRPLHGFLTSGPPPVDSYDVLQVATDTLNASLLKQGNQDLAPWSWFSWAKWYALAVLLAELCGCHRGPKIEKAWYVAEASFPQIMGMMVDDALKSSMERLMTKARSVRDGFRVPISPAATGQGMLLSDEAPETNGFDDQTLHVSNSSLGGRDQVLPWNEDLDMKTPSKSDPLRQQFSPLAPNQMRQDPLMEDPEALAWINWEAFVNDVTDVNDSIPPFLGEA